MFTINDPMDQYAKLTEKCCIGNGQLACLVNLSRNSQRGSLNQSNFEPDHKAYSAVNINVGNSPVGIPSKVGASSSDDERQRDVCSNLLPFTSISNTNGPNVFDQKARLDLHKAIGGTAEDCQSSFGVVKNGTMSP